MKTSFEIVIEAVNVPDWGQKGYMALVYHKNELYYKTPAHATVEDAIKDVGREVKYSELIPTLEEALNHEVGL